MNLVIDTNIVFSAILNSESSIGQIILNGSKYFNFFSIVQLNNEIDNHEDKILKISGLTQRDYHTILDLIKSKIKFVNHLLINSKNYQKAYELTKDIDPDDLLFVGLSIQFDCKLWTGDRQLISGLFKKQYKQYITTEELFQIYLEKELNRE